MVSRMCHMLHVRGYSNKLYGAQRHVCSGVFACMYAFYAARTQRGLSPTGEHATITKSSKKSPWGQRLVTAARDVVGKGASVSSRPCLSELACPSVR
jgi:hypothetical protein